MPGIELPQLDYGLIRLTPPSSTARSSGNTIKVRNVFFSLKTFTTVLLDTAAGVVSIVSAPHLFWLHGLRLLASLKKTATIEFTEGEAIILCALHSKHGFGQEVSEDALYATVLEYCATMGLAPIRKPDFIVTNTKLSKLEAIEISEGVITLVEKVNIG